MSWSFSNYKCSSWSSTYPRSQQRCWKWFECISWVIVQTHYSCSKAEHAYSTRYSQRIVSDHTVSWQRWSEHETQEGGDHTEENQDTEKKIHTEEERHREREKQRQTNTHTQRQTNTHTKTNERTQTQRQTNKQTQTQRQTNTHTHTHKHKGTGRYRPTRHRTERQSDREIQTDTTQDRETERDRKRERRADLNFKSVPHIQSHLHDSMILLSWTTKRL